jgi:putative endonuclease
MAGHYFVYILSSQTRVLYVGVTSDLGRRLWEHRTGQYDGFTRRYRVNRLVHVEATHEVHAAIAREKQIKGWRREKKRALIESENPGWDDLSLRWQFR